MKNILILGGDGYLGWPTAMHFAKMGDKVTVIDNYFRRNACNELDTGMLYPVPTLPERVSIFNEITGNNINVIIGDLSEPRFMREVFENIDAPDTIIHYAEQPSPFIRL